MIVVAVPAGAITIANFLVPSTQGSSSSSWNNSRCSRSSSSSSSGSIKHYKYEWTSILMHDFDYDDGDDDKVV